VEGRASTERTTENFHTLHADTVFSYGNGPEACVEYAVLAVERCLIHMDVGSIANIESPAFYWRREM
jgi:hypothetical protein